MLYSYREYQSALNPFNYNNQEGRLCRFQNLFCRIWRRFSLNGNHLRGLSRPRISINRVARSCAQILEAIALDIETAQTELAQAEKSKVGGIAESRILVQKLIVRSDFGRVLTKSNSFPNTVHFAHRSLDSGCHFTGTGCIRCLSTNPIQ